MSEPTSAPLCGHRQPHDPHPFSTRSETYPDQCGGWPPTINPLPGVEHYPAQVGVTGARLTCFACKQPWPCPTEQERLDRYSESGPTFTEDNTDPGVPTEPGAPDPLTRAQRMAARLTAPGWSVHDEDCELPPDHRGRCGLDEPSDGTIERHRIAGLIHAAIYCSGSHDEHLAECQKAADALFAAGAVSR